MKFRRDAAGDPSLNESRDEMRELAEALSLYRSAMHHLAERQAAKPWTMERHHGRAKWLAGRLGLVLAPALAAAIAAGVLIPVYSHSHERHAVPAATATVNNARQAPAQTLASVDDTVLMNQIDSELNKDVPDALEPLADLGDQAAGNISLSEKKNAKKE